MEQYNNYKENAYYVYSHTDWRALNGKTKNAK